MTLKGFIQCAATEDSKMELGKQAKRGSLPRLTISRKQKIVFRSVPVICGGILGDAGR